MSASSPNHSGPDHSGEYTETTDGIRIVVLPKYLPGESRPEQDVYVFAYTIRIENVGGIPTQLLTRHWIIRDSNGEQREVRGPGVVGRQPILEPGQSFTYTSFCPLQSPEGSMRGSYQMMDENGRRYDVIIPEFTLCRL